MATGIEIERKFLLDAVPDLPDRAIPIRIEQGYLRATAPSAMTDDVASPRPGPADAALDAATDADGLPQLGRLRRATDPDGRVVHTHTVKTGVGVVRRETEVELDAETFARAWPRTEGRRLRKTRYRVPPAPASASASASKSATESASAPGPRERSAPDPTWEIDVFEDRPLVLAEVEFDDPEQVIEPPAWLAPHIQRDVTDDPAYTNAALATDRGEDDGERDRPA